MISTSAPCLLIVDDEPMVLQTLKTLLSLEGYQVTTVEAPREALQLVANGNFAVIISDHRMPGMTGLAFLAECRRLRPVVSRILLSAAFDLKEVMQAVEREDICRFLAKPWLREELLTVLRDAVRRHELMVRNATLQEETARLSALLAAAGIAS
jgi:DNA-binding NtrC family response regulator